MAKRSKEFKRSSDLMNSLEVVNSSIENLEIGSSGEELKYRPVFLVGCSRSGSTLFMQWLANSGAFSYPTNLIARFYKNPAFGAYVQRILIDDDSSNQIFTTQTDTAEFNSSLGHTKGPLAPSEFWYFWRQYFHFNETQFLTENELRKVDIGSFKRKLARFESVNNKPLLLKAMILNWNIDFLYQLFPNALFIHIKRDQFQVATSILNARKRFFGSTKHWWSFKPIEYNKISKLTPIQQVSCQVYFTVNTVQKALEAIPEFNKYDVHYESFCTHPERHFHEISDRHGGLKDLSYRGVSEFEPRTASNLDKNLLGKIKYGFELAAELEGNS